jgi:hypothetical protein
MLINAGATHPHALWLERLREAAVPLTIATEATPGQGGQNRAPVRRVLSVAHAGDVPERQVCNMRT